MGYSARRGFTNGKISGAQRQAEMQARIQQMQEQVNAAQEAVESQEFTASVGGGVVEAKVNGKKEVLSVTIKPEAVDPEDVEMLQDLVVSAVNEALRQAGEAMDKGIEQATGNLNLGGLRPVRAGISVTDKRSGAAGSALLETGGPMKRRFLAAALACALLTGCGPVRTEPADTESAPADEPVIAYVPLDDRPDNAERVVYLADSLGYELLLPEADDYHTALDGQPLNENGTQSGDRADLFEWVLAQEEAGCDRYILSLDQLLSGGLVNSRAMAAEEPVTPLRRQDPGGAGAAGGADRGARCR